MIRILDLVIFVSIFNITLNILFLSTIGLVNDFLSWGFFAPLSRLTFFMYLIHLDFERMFYGSMDYTYDFSNLQMVSLICNQVMYPHYDKKMGLEFSNLFIITYYSWPVYLVYWANDDNRRTVFCGDFSLRNTFCQARDDVDWR